MTFFHFFHFLWLKLDLIRKGDLEPSSRISPTEILLEALLKPRGNPISKENISPFFKFFASLAENEQKKFDSFGKEALLALIQFEKWEIVFEGPDGHEELREKLLESLLMRIVLEVVDHLGDDKWEKFLDLISLWLKEDESLEKFETSWNSLLKSLKSDQP